MMQTLALQHQMQASHTHTITKYPTFYTGKIRISSFTAKEASSFAYLHGYNGINYFLCQTESLALGKQQNSLTFADVGICKIPLTNASSVDKLLFLLQNFFP